MGAAALLSLIKVAAPVELHRDISFASGSCTYSMISLVINCAHNSEKHRIHEYSLQLACSTRYELLDAIIEGPRVSVDRMRACQYYIACHDTLAKVSV